MPNPPTEGGCEVKSPWFIAILPKQLKRFGAQLRKPIGRAKRRWMRLIRKQVRHRPAPALPIETVLENAHWSLLKLLRRQFLLEVLE